MKYLAYIILFFLIVAYLSSCVGIHESSSKQSAIPDTTKADSLSTIKDKEKEIGAVAIIFLFMVLVIIRIRLYH
jgi:predicted ferric reductase